MSVSFEFPEDFNCVVCLISLLCVFVFYISNVFVFYISNVVVFFALCVCFLNSHFFFSLVFFVSNKHTHFSILISCFRIFNVSVG